MPAVGEVDIIRTLSKKMNEIFPGVNVNDRDQKEGFDRPSFFIDWINTKSGKAGEFDSDECFFEIVYYAPDRYTGFLNLLQVKKQLQKALSGKLVLEPGEGLQDTEHFIMECEDLEFSVNNDDKALIANFLIRLVQQQDADREDDYGYLLMQELDNDIKVNGD